MACQPPITAGCRRAQLLLLTSLALSAPASAQLFDQAELVTCPGCAAGGADASEDSSGAIGFAAFAPWRLADDFQVLASDGWELEFVRVFAYESGAQPGTPTITSATLQIWSGLPGAAGSNIVFGDAVTDRLASVSFADAYRIPIGFPLNDPQRPIFEVQLAAQVLLLPGDYWIDFQLAGDPSLSGPWMPSNPGSLGAGSLASTNGFQDVFVLPEELAFTLEGAPSPLATVYCSGQPNSSGSGAALTAGGSRYVGLNNLELRLAALPPGQAAYFLTSQTQALVPVPGTQGDLCLGGAVGRYAAQVFSASAMGTGALLLDLSQTPTPQGTAAILRGETWSFQAWYRDANPVPTSNFSDGLEIEFR